MGNVGCLNNVLDHDRRLSVYFVTQIFFCGTCLILERLFPPSVAKFLEVFVDNVCTHDRLRWDEEQGQEQQLLVRTIEFDHVSQSDVSNEDLRSQQVDGIAKALSLLEKAFL